MAFKSAKLTEESKFGDFLRIANDGQSVTGVFLYRDYDDVLTASAHYVKSRKYTGYVHCLDNSSCPLCKKGIRVQNKLFIPFLVLADKTEGYEENKVVFWDRNLAFIHQLRNDVFDKYPCPTDIVFKITRHGAYRDINTKYSIIAEYNYNADIQDALDELGVSLPDYYENVIKSMTASEIYDVLNDSDEGSDDAYRPTENYTYNAKPRKQFVDPSTIDVDDVPSSDISESEESSSPVLSDYKLSDYTPDSADTDISDSSDSSDDDIEPTF